MSTKQNEEKGSITHKHQSKSISRREYHPTPVCVYIWLCCVTPSMCQLLSCSKPSRGPTRATPSLSTGGRWASQRTSCSEDRWLYLSSSIVRLHLAVWHTSLGWVLPKEDIQRDLGHHKTKGGWRCVWGGWEGGKLTLLRKMPKCLVAVWDSDSHRSHSAAAIRLLQNEQIEWVISRVT